MPENFGVRSVISKLVLPSPLTSLLRRLYWGTERCAHKPSLKMAWPFYHTVFCYFPLSLTPMEEEEGGADGFKVLWETSEIFLYNVGVMDWIVFSPQNSYFEILTPKSDGIRRWGLWEEYEGKALIYGISAHKKKVKRRLLPLFEDTTKRCPSVNQEAFIRYWIWKYYDPGLLRLQNHEK